MTWARDYGLKRIKKVSPFVLEALDIPGMPDEVLRASAVEELRRYALAEDRPRPAVRARPPAVLPLSHVQVEDYLVCPLKHRFRHVMRVPVMPHHTLVFGRVLHSAIHFYLRNRMRGKAVSEDEFLGEYAKGWVNEGFLSREHEELRKTAGERALRLFYRREEESGRVPAFLEKTFRWQEAGVRFSGRFDRVDFEEEGPVIIDFKTSEASSQKEADRRTADSLQMDIYALSFLKTQGLLPAETRLYFLESGLIGHARKGEREFRRAAEKIRQAADGIRAGNFEATPDWHSCNFCDFKTICPSSYAY
jgi:DNA helicase-2/ATP-dependent DNA helicase PcrA